MNRFGLSALCLLGALGGRAEANEADRVQIDSGVLIGTSDADVRTFKGVPYTALGRHKA
jgi:hypothetical protein